MADKTETTTDKPFDSKNDKSLDAKTPVEVAPKQATTSTPAKQVKFEPIGERVFRAYIEDPLRIGHLGTLTKEVGKEPTFMPTLHHFMTASQMREIVEEMEKKV